jgi:AcrR family transcriptional regulator
MPITGEDDQSMVTAPRTGRRRSHENRELLLTAANELFAAQGYAHTTTKQITERAGVVESTLFRHFGSKAEIFKATVVEPCAQVFGAWTESLQVNPNASLEDSIDQLVTGLATLVLQNRAVLLSLVVADYQGDTELSIVANDIRDQVLSSVEAVTATGGGLLNTHRGSGRDLAVSVSTVFGLVLGSILLRDWVFRDNQFAPTDKAVIREIVEMAVAGMCRPRPHPDQPGGERP